jgi:hypothetical protein
MSVDDRRSRGARLEVYHAVDQAPAAPAAFCKPDLDSSARVCTTAATLDIHRAGNVAPRRGIDLAATVRMRPPGRTLAGPLAVLTIALLAGCASTRSAAMGRLPNDENLVSLTVTQDRSIVEQQCEGVPAVGRILGCQTMRTLVLPDGEHVRLVKIVRFTDTLPSEMAFEIDLHELCHAIASVQSVPDPCHVGNNGTLQSAVPRALRLP